MSEEHIAPELLAARARTPLLVVKEPRRRYIVGWKIANPLINIATGALTIYPAFVTSNATITYGVEATARCNYYPHEAPFHGCFCGFNAYDERDTAEVRLSFDPLSNGMCRQSLSLMRVGLYGRVHEGTMSDKDDTWGYRAEKCVVADIFVPNTCRVCRGPVTQFALNVCMHYSYGRYGGSERFFQPRCDSCTDVHMMPIADVRERVERAGVGFHWTDE